MDSALQEKLSIWVVTTLKPTLEGAFAQKLKVTPKKMVNNRLQSTGFFEIKM
ncbi:MAG: hypothetical protein V7L04_05805 [Nostoc sp.]|uniref:hypothetical protein n=1 Tax=Nostoc sp. TaxID=1180 RepID=UPI002FF5FDE7